MVHLEEWPVGIAWAPAQVCRRWPWPWPCWGLPLCGDGRAIPQCSGLTDFSFSRPVQELSLILVLECSLGRRCPFLSLSVILCVEVLGVVSDPGKLQVSAFLRKESGQSMCFKPLLNSLGRACAFINVQSCFSSIQTSLCLSLEAQV